MRGTIMVLASVATLPLLSAGPAAAATSSCTITVDERAICQLSKITAALDISELISQLSAYGIADDPIFWIQAWGGDGAAGTTSNGGQIGEGGYAQTTTTLSALESVYGTTEIYYYLGQNGTGGANAGGDGGTATLVTVNDLAAEDVDIDQTLLIAGGGGGGGAGRGKQVCGGTLIIRGGDGGAAGSAFATVGIDDTAAGSRGSSRAVPGVDGRVNNSGYGGGAKRGGSGDDDETGNATDGDDPTAPLGGRGGNHDSPQIGFVNASGTQVTGGGGQGGDGGNGAGGGGGGGGYTGGGGGNRGTLKTECVSGGGGGGSSFARWVSSSPTTDCSAIPTERPGNPNGHEGLVQITFDVGACD